MSRNGFQIGWKASQVAAGRTLSGVTTAPVVQTSIQMAGAQIRELRCESCGCVAQRNTYAVQGRSADEGKHTLFDCDRCKAVGQMVARG